MTGTVQIRLPDIHVPLKGWTVNREDVTSSKVSFLPFTLGPSSGGRSK
jgi:hypothetical protein